MCNSQVTHQENSSDQTYIGYDECPTLIHNQAKYISDTLTLLTLIRILCWIGWLEGVTFQSGICFLDCFLKLTLEEDFTALQMLTKSVLQFYLAAITC